VRRLFFRIFLSFWLLLVAVVLLLVVFDPDLFSSPRGLSPSVQRLFGDRPPPPIGPGGPDRGRPPDFGSPSFGDDRFGSPPPHAMGKGPIADRVLDALSHGGAPAVNRLAGDLKDENGLAITVYDARLDFVAGASDTSTSRSLARRCLEYGDLQLSPSRGTFENAVSFGDESGREYVLVEIVSPASVDYPAVLERVVGVVAVAGLICWWLSRQITIPIIALRLAARDIAAGKLQTRVTALMGRRKDELGELASDFDAMASRLESMVSAQTRLLADVSHELRSPLTRLSLAAAIARRGTTDPQSVATLDRVDREVERLNELIGQLTMISKLESGVAAGTSEPIDLGAMASEICADARFEAESAGKRIDLHGAEDGPAVVAGNSELLRRAIENVVRNAVRYTGEGTSVEVRVRRDGNRAEVSVRDHGVGVSEAELTEIFKPFYRTAAARDRESGGVGLGLAIADRAVRRHGGTISAANAAGGGLNVTILLPIRPAVAEPPLTRAKESTD
jgi:two-component system sensor histidine kinase CpxA